MRGGVVTVGRLGRLYSNPVHPDPDQELDNQVPGPDTATLAQNPSIGIPFPHSPFQFNDYSQGGRIDIWCCFYLLGPRSMRHKIPLSFLQDICNRCGRICSTFHPFSYPLFRFP